MSKYGVFPGPDKGKYGSEKTLYLDTFHTVILILMGYACALSSPPYDWYPQKRLLALEIFIKICSKFNTTSLCLPQFHFLTGCDTVIHIFTISKTSAIYLIGTLGKSTTASENLTYHVMGFIQKYINHGKTNEELVEMRMGQYNTMETKTTHTILLDPHSFKEQIK